MKEAVKKLDDLLTFLEDKIAATEVLNKQLSENKLALADVERRQLASANQLSARERIVKKYEDFEKERQSLKDAAKKASENSAEAVKKSKYLDVREVGIDLKEKNLEKMTAVFQKKNANMDAKEVEYKAKFKLMKETVIKELTGKA